MTIKELTDAERIKGLLEVNARQAQLVEQLQQALTLQRRANAQLRRRLQEHDMAQTMLPVREPDPLGRDPRDA